MPAKRLTESEAKLLRRGLSRWENEGGLVATLSADFAESKNELSRKPRVTNIEVEHLRARIVALESVTIAMLATTSEGQLALVREMAKYIAPRPGSTQHPLTKDACLQILSLVRRAEQLRD